jgi:hypothetical protein
MKNGHGSEKIEKVREEKIRLSRRGKARAVGAIFTVVTTRSILGTDPRKTGKRGKHECAKSQGLFALWNKFKSSSQAHK